MFSYFTHHKRRGRRVERKLEPLSRGCSTCGGALTSAEVELELDLSEGNGKKEVLRIG